MHLDDSYKKSPFTCRCRGFDNNLDHNLKPPHLTDQEQIAEEKFKVYGAAVQIFQSNPTLDNQLKAVSAFDSFNEVYLKPENGGSHGQ